ncbi:hypothetical protein AWH63_10320 [Marinobacter sp. C18]|uniref:outer membrane beta-barrel protein n=1 Tax=Marinobacter sp. C18 TaxID=1772288 RepID=UPI0009489A3C|nr:outer membrane beta-barrel protein [Marinobacter sp. C18]OLF81927.1 hypothetical protein AWH63_10320 [Marinobacter sp. C18]
MLKTKTLAASIIIASIGMSGSAMAAGPVFYTGLNAGWNATEFEESSVIDVGGTITKSESTGSASGPAFGGVAGIKFPISTGYFGLEAHVSDSGAEFEETQFVNDQQTIDKTISSNLSVGLSGILAFNVNAHSQIYGIAGYQMTSVEVESSTRDTGTGDVTNDEYDEDLGGFRVGVGLETAITRSLSARLEWTHTAFSSEEYQINTANGVVDSELEGAESRIAIGVIGHF